jgi:pyruvate-formate lyase-activating enzyme
MLNPDRTEDLFNSQLDVLQISLWASSAEEYEKNYPGTPPRQFAKICEHLRCALCPLADGLERPLGQMDLETFCGMLDQTGNYLFSLYLWNWGKPFLNPEAYKMIAYARQKGVKVISSTNGHPFADGKEAEKLVESGIDVIIFSMDGATQNNYEQYRRGGQLSTVLKGIENVLACKRLAGAERPSTVLQFLVTKHNEREISPLKEMARELGVDLLVLKTINPYLLDPYGQKGEQASNSSKALLPENPVYRRFPARGDESTIKQCLGASSPFPLDGASRQCRHRGRNARDCCCCQPHWRSSRDRSTSGDWFSGSPRRFRGSGPSIDCAFEGHQPN